MIYNPLYKNGAVYRVYEVSENAYRHLREELLGVVFFRETEESFFAKITPPYYDYMDLVVKHDPLGVVLKEELK